MPDTELFRYRITVSGRIQGHDRKDAEDRLKAGMNFTLPVHESIDEVVIETMPDTDFTQVRSKFS